MTLDEAIKHAEEVVEEQDKLCKRYDDASGYTRSHNEDIRTTNAKECVKCAEEHRQLAEWLRDYKRLLEQEPCEDCIRRVEALKIATTEYELKKIRELPSVKPQEPKWDRLYSRLNDMRFGIAPDETVTDIDERHVRTAQVDMLDEIMEWMIEPQESENKE